MTDGELLGDYVARRDASAFEVLVRRYGALVYRVCRDVLNDPHEVEDAFQATFLVLVRRADSIREREAVGRWLYETAYRIAIRARMNARRRLARERQGVEMMSGSAAESEAENRELRPLLHAELRRLPESLRAPLTLCYLEGQSYEEAARTLHLPLGTLKGRLVRGRELLRSRLQRRGVGATALLLLLLPAPGTSVVPESLESATIELLSRFLTSGSLMPTIPGRQRDLVEAELRRYSASRLGQAAVAIVAITAILLSGIVMAPAVAGTTQQFMQSLISSTGPVGGGACHVPAEEGLE